nr:Cytosine/adenosine deaminase [Pandoravirus aubagnensis]
MRAVRPSRLVVRGVTLGGTIGRSGPVDVLLERGAKGKILAIGDRQSCDALDTDPHTTHVLDAQGLVALPGIFNAHATTIPDRHQTTTVGSTAARSSERTAHASTLARAMATMVAMLKTGTTSALFPIQTHPEAVIEAAVRVGMRATVAVIAQDSAIRGDPATAAAIDVERVMSLARRWRPHPTVTLALGLDATLAQCRPAYLDAIVGLSAKYDLPVHAHVDRRNAASSYARSVTRLNRLALCSARLSIAICDTVKGGNDTDAPVAVCSSVPPFERVMDRWQSLWPLAAATGGGLGCPFERMRRLASIDGTMGAHDAWRLAVRPGRRGRTTDVLDSLCVGDAADLVLIDPARFAPLQSRLVTTTTTTTTTTISVSDDNANAVTGGASVRCHRDKGGTLDGEKGHATSFATDAIVRHCRSSDVACVIVAGRIVVALGTATLVDEHAIVR